MTITSRKKKKINPMLMNVLLISGAVHLIAFLILGSITVYKYIIPEDAQFEEPPEVAVEEPPKEIKIEIKPKTAQQKPLQQLRIKQVGNIAVPKIDVDLPTMDQSFTVSSGLGGTGRGNLLGGTNGTIGIGMSDVNVFGLKSRAERVLFVIDAGKHMLEDSKGGLHSYRIIKQEVANMVANLSAGTLFNVAFYDNGNLYFFKPRPIPAGAQVTAELQKWIGPINTDAKKLGLPSRVRPEIKTLPEHPAHKAILSTHYHTPNNNAYLTQVFLEQSIDAVFLITGRHEGFDPIRRKPTEAEEEKWRKKTSDPKYQEALKLFKAEEDKLKKQANNKLNNLNKQRAKNGLPPKIIDGSILGAMGLKNKIPHPGYSPKYTIEQRQVERYFKDLVRELYESRGGKMPTMNVILFLAADAKADEKQEVEIKTYVRFFKGSYKVIRGLNQIKGASAIPAPDEPQ